MYFGNFTWVSKFISKVLVICVTSSQDKTIATFILGTRYSSHCKKQKKIMKKSYENYLLNASRLKKNWNWKLIFRSPHLTTNWNPESHEFFTNISEFKKKTNFCIGPKGFFSQFKKKSQQTLLHILWNSIKLEIIYDIWGGDPTSIPRNGSKWPFSMFLLIFVLRIYDGITLSI